VASRPAPRAGLGALGLGLLIVASAAEPAVTAERLDELVGRFKLAV
jgi:hypothetical protein